MRKRKPLNITAYDIDIMGEREAFKVPDSALYFETIQASAEEDMKHDVCIMQLKQDWRDRCIMSELLIHDLDDKIRVVEHLHKTGHIDVWRGKKVNV